MKKSRKAKVFYTLLNKAGNEVKIDLNNYKVTCTRSGKRKSFYHKYLANLIQTKYQNNIDLFRDTYVSREASKVDHHARKVEQVKDQIDRATARLAGLKEKLASMQAS